LIDDSLDWNVAEALRLVGYNVTSVHKAFNGQSGVKDPVIIEWCKVNNATWVHADDKARKEHKKEGVFLTEQKDYGMYPYDRRKGKRDLSQNYGKIYT